MFPRKQIRYYSLKNYVLIATWWRWFGYNFYYYTSLKPFIRSRTPASWVDLLMRTDPDARTIRKLINKILVFPRYEGMTPGEIYNDIS